MMPFGKNCYIALESSRNGEFDERWDDTLKVVQILVYHNGSPESYLLAISDEGLYRWHHISGRLSFDFADADAGGSRSLKVTSIDEVE